MGHPPFLKFFFYLKSKERQFLIPLFQNIPIAPYLKMYGDVSIRITATM